MLNLRVLNFGYVMGVDVTIMYINFQINLWVSLKVVVRHVSYCLKSVETWYMG